MGNFNYGAEQAAPPSFEEAKNLRQRARVAGMDPNYWYAVAMVSEVKPGEVKEVQFWKRSFALFRGQDGQLGCIENRCAHRQLKLSEGTVDGCTVRCAYHGWSYDCEGQLVDMPHDNFGKTLRLKLDHFPIAERYGLIFLFPGDPELLSTRKIPEIPELAGPKPWTHDVLDFVWQGHHSMILDNVSDFTHGHLHRKWRPFEGDKLLSIEEGEDQVLLHYNAKIGAARVMDLLIDRKAHAGDQHLSCYQYPYQWSNTEDFVKHFLFVLPVDERTTRVFFLLYYRHFKVPFLPLEVPERLMTPLVKLGHKWLVRPLFDEDGWAVQREQEAFERHFTQPIAEVNPMVTAYQRLTVRKWEAYLETQKLVAVKKKRGAKSVESADA